MGDDHEYCGRQEFSGDMYTNVIHTHFILCHAADWMLSNFEVFSCTYLVYYRRAEKIVRLRVRR